MRKATLQSYYKYYPYGMLHPSRIYNENTYDFGFNGMLMDNQIPDAINSSGDENVGANYTADFWQYDSRLGRRWNVDPIDKPWESDYACFRGNPIYYADPSGLDGEDPPKKRKGENAEPMYNAGFLKVFEIKSTKIEPKLKWYQKIWIFIREVSDVAIEKTKEWWEKEKTWRNNANSYGRLTIKVTYGQQLKLGGELFGINISGGFNGSSQDWLKFTWEQKKRNGYLLMDTNTDFEYLYDDEKNTMQEGWVASFIGGYSKNTEYEKYWKGKNYGEITNKITSETISFLIANQTKKVNETTGIETKEQFLNFGVSISALIGIEINYKQALTDEEF